MLSVRMRSFVGCIAVVLGLTGTLVGLFRGVLWVVIAGLAAWIGGMLLVGWAIRDVVRQIGAAQTEFEARLRREIGDKTEPKG